MLTMTARTGAAISTRRFVNMLRRENYEVQIITTGGPGPGKIILPEFYFPGARKVMKLMKTPFAFPAGRKLSNALRNADLVHVRFPFFSACVP
jgi:1,2-diacylglycerol 3-alpha-glucosyltransferase